MVAQTRTLINRTGHPLAVTLVFRKGDHPTLTSGSVAVTLAAGADPKTGQDRSRQEVAYGDAVDTHLGRIETQLMRDGAVLGAWTIEVVRGSGLDRALDTLPVIEFLFDGRAVVVSCVPPERERFAFAAATPEPT